MKRRNYKVEMSSMYGKIGNTDVLSMSLDELDDEQKALKELERKIYEVSLKEYEEHGSLLDGGFSKEYSLQPKVNTFREKFRAMFFTATVFYLLMVAVMSMFIMWKFHQ